MKKDIRNKIRFMLYNYENIEKFIEERRRDLIDRINPTKGEWLRAKKTKGNTLEDISIDIAEDKYIIKMKEWKDKLDNYIAIKSKMRNKIFVDYITLKYFRKLSNQIICKKLNIDNKKIKELDKKIIEEIEMLEGEN